MGIPLLSEPEAAAESASLATLRELRRQLLPGLPSGAFWSNGHRKDISSTAHNIVAAGRFNGYRAHLLKGDVVTSISFFAGGTAGASLTNSWCGLYDASLNKIEVTDNNTGASWATATTRTWTLVNPYTVTATAAFYVFLLVTGTTMPTLAGATTPAASATGSAISPVVTGTSTTGLTNPASAPATAAALSAFAGHAYFWLS